VTFRFFHRVRDLVPSAAGGRIDGIVVEPQLPAGVRQADLFGRQKGRCVWPSAPLVCDESGPRDGRDLIDTESFYGELRNAPVRLERGRDFDQIVLALPGGCLPADARSAFEQAPSWQRMDEHVRYLDSISYRVWFARSLAELGWKGAPAILSGFAYPLSTWEDNSQNLDHEGFEDERPRAIGTVFGPLACPARATLDPAEGRVHERDQQRCAREHVSTFLQGPAARLWPGILTPDGQLDPMAFFHPDGAEGQARLDWQLVRANVGPIERYVMASPGTLQHRLRPEESGYENLLLAGEHTRNGYEVGCLEGAVNSGLIAARAISGDPMRIAGERDFDFGLLHAAGETGS
jgi:hypothetical protein